MKKLFTKTKVLTGFPMALLCCLLVFGTTTANAQGPCENTSQYPFTSVAASAVFGANVNIVTNAYAGSEYSTIDGIVAGYEYILTHAAGSYVTVREGAVDGAVVSSGFSPLTFSAVSASDIYVHWNVDATCTQDATGSFATDITTVGLPPCDMTSVGGQWPTTTVTVGAGVTTTIATNSYGSGEFSIITALVSGNYYQIEHANGSYITVREGAVDGPAIANGFSPVAFTASSASDLYVHWTEDAACTATSAGSYATSIQDFGLPPCDMTSESGQWPFGSITADAGGAVTSISTNSYSSGEFSVITGVLNAHEYEFAHANGSYITVRVGAADGPLLGSGASPLMVQANSTADLYVHWTEDAACTATSTGSFATTVQDLGVPPCDNSPLAFSLYPASPITPDAGGAVTTITTDQYVGSEYSVITGVQASSNYEFTHAAGSYITVRVGAVDGPVLGAGFSPLQVAAVTTDDLYVHWTVDEFCDVDATGSHLTTVQFLGAACLAEAGTLTPVDAQVCLAAAIEAVEDNAPVVPVGYALVYVVTQDPNLTVVAGPLSTPTYTPTVAGTYTIHAMVIDPADQGTILAEVPNGGAAVAALFEENGGALCGSLDVAGATFTVVVCPDNDLCADAETIACGDVVSGDFTNATTDLPTNDCGNSYGQGVWYVYAGTGDEVTVATCGSTTDTEITVLEGDCGLLTCVDNSDDDCGVQSTVTFTSVVGTDYYVYVSWWSSTSTVTNGLFDLSVTCTCPAEGGTLTADATPVCLSSGSADISATEATAPVVPAGYSVLYVLTSNPGLIIEAVNATPEFTVTAGGEYTIHTLVYNPATLDLSVVVFGTTAAQDVLDIVGTNDICAALDVTGAPITVNAPEVGATVADATPVCLVGGSADIGAESDGNEVVPTGYSLVYVLTDADNGLEILDANATGDFTVNAGGSYIIHTFVYDAVAVPDLAPFVGQSATVVVDAIGDGSVCAALDVTGAPITVDVCTGISDNLSVDAIAVYPNPSNGQFVIEVDGVEGDAQITVMDVAGRQIYTQGVNMNGNFREELNLNVASGTYLLQINTVEGKVTRKIQIN